MAIIWLPKPVAKRAKAATAMSIGIQAKLGLGAILVWLSVAAVILPIGRAVFCTFLAIFRDQSEKMFDGAKVEKTILMGEKNIALLVFQVYQSKGCRLNIEYLINHAGDGQGRLVLFFSAVRHGISVEYCI